MTRLLTLSVIVAKGMTEVQTIHMFYNSLTCSILTHWFVLQVHATKLAAFDSPNMPPLLTANIDFTVDWDAVIRPGSKPFSATVAMDPNVAVCPEQFDSSL
jgi:L-asparaginase/Glu-tRNA(Gln) amidotransferase subunit D